MGLYFNMERVIKYCVMESEVVWLRLFKKKLLRNIAVKNLEIIGGLISVER